MVYTHTRPFTYLYEEEEKIDKVAPCQFAYQLHLVLFLAVIYSDFFQQCILLLSIISQGEILPCAPAGESLAGTAPTGAPKGGGRGLLPSGPPSAGRSYSVVAVAIQAARFWHAMAGLFFLA